MKIVAFMFLAIVMVSQVKAASVSTIGCQGERLHDIIYDIQGKFDVEKFEGNFYYFSKTKETLTWPDAEAECADIGGHLASIHTKAEHEFISGVFHLRNVDAFWIGLNDGEVKDKFVWSDKTPNDFSKWHAGEPNDAHGVDERCVEAWGRNGNYGWNDRGCYSQKVNYVCKA